MTYKIFAHFLLADSETNETDTLDGLASQQSQLFTRGVVDDVLETGDEPTTTAAIGHTMLQRHCTVTQAVQPSYVKNSKKR